MAAGCVWRMDCRKQPGSCALPKEDRSWPLLKAECWVSQISLIQDTSFSQLMISKTGIILVLHGSILASELLEFAFTA